jgi:hypothetical protein
VRKRRAVAGEAVNPARARRSAAIEEFFPGAAAPDQMAGRQRPCLQNDHVIGPCMFALAARLAEIPALAMT